MSPFGTVSQRCFTSRGDGTRTALRCADDDEVYAHWNRRSGQGFGLTADTLAGLWQRLRWRKRSVRGRKRHRLSGRSGGYQKQKPRKNGAFGDPCQLSAADAENLKKRRTRGSNPQPITGQLISNQPADHSLILRTSFNNRWHGVSRQGGRGREKNLIPKRFAAGQKSGAEVLDRCAYRAFKRSKDGAIVTRIGSRRADSSLAAIHWLTNSSADWSCAIAVSMELRCG